jgi:capsid portal protein
MKEKEFRRKVKGLNDVAVTVIKKGDNTAPDQLVATNAETSYFSRQMEEDPFSGLYAKNRVVKPPYDLDWLSRMYEESDALQENLDARVQNTVGMGWDLNYLGEDLKPKSALAVLEENRARNFFAMPNEEDDWDEITTEAFLDHGMMGNGAIEFVRNRRKVSDAPLGEVKLAYYHPFKDLRLVPVEKDDYFTDTFNMMRDGKPEKMQITTCYRRFLKIMPGGKVRYYRSFGDPRPLTTDGKREYNPKKDTSELLWIKNFKGSSTPYGLPDWIGSTFDVAGRRNAQALNWDLMRTQGIPRMLIMVEGKLSDASWDDLYDLIEAARGVKNFNKIAVLEVQGIAGAIGQKGASSIRVQDLSGIQKTDQMFNSYQEGTFERIRQNFRHAPIFVGSTGAYSYAALNVSKSVGEEQVFGPIKRRWDGRVNRKLIAGERGFNITNWEYKTKSAEIASTDDLLRAITILSAAGALSVNNVIDLANAALGRTVSKYDKPWANYPANMVLAMLNRTGVKGMEDVEVAQQPTEPPSPVVAALSGQKQLALPTGTDNAPVVGKNELDEITKSVAGLVAELSGTAKKKSNRKGRDNGHG